MHWNEHFRLSMMGIGCVNLPVYSMDVPLSMARKRTACDEERGIERGEVTGGLAIRMQTAEGPDAVRYGCPAIPTPASSCPTAIPVCV